MIKRNPELLWREAEDGTILTLCERTGRAFVLSGSMATLWKKLDEEMVLEDFSAQFGEVGEEDQKRFLDQLCEARIVTVDDKPLAELDPFPQPIAFCIPSVVEINFGACDCSGGFAGLFRWFECTFGPDRRVSSIIY